MSEQPREGAAGGAEGLPLAAGREKPPVKQRPKMTLDEQSSFLFQLLRRCQCHGPELKGIYAGAAILTLSEDEMLKLETIQQTIEVFHMNNAAELVRQEIWRKRGKASGR